MDKGILRDIFSKVEKHELNSRQALALLKGDSSETRENLQTTIVAYLYSILPDDHKIETGLNFMEAGLDSETLLRLMERVETDFGITLTAAIFFRYPNIDKLATYLASEYRENFQRLLSRQEFKGTPEGDIAVIGMAGRFAQAPDLQKFWEHLKQCKSLIAEIPTKRRALLAWPEEGIYCRWGSFIENVGQFDALFFNISPREAEIMDPQLRLLLETLYATVEDAGYVCQIKGSFTGVFIGACYHDYEHSMIQQGIVGTHNATGTAFSMIAGRPSFYFDLKGPCMTIDTACSSSLVALHTACCALRNKECEMAFVGGVNLILNPHHYLYFCKLGALSAKGHCCTFGADADGYVPGEGVAAVLLKPFAQAVKDHDHIYGIIKGSAVSHGGHTSSVTAPSPQRQAGLIQKAWQAAKIKPETISYIEAHGTGTKLGDPVEIEGLKLAFQAYTSKKGFCGLGSVKTNIGHTEATAGIAGLMKVLLAMQHRTLPGMADFGQCSPHIDLKNSPLYLQVQTASWETKEAKPRRAGVSSFGFGGTYAHVVLEEYCPPEKTEVATAKNFIFPFSAQSDHQLRQLLQAFEEFLEDYPQNRTSLADMAFTLQQGRDPMKIRSAFVAQSLDELRQKIHRSLQSNALEKIRPSEYETLDEVVRSWIEGSSIDWNSVMAPGHCSRVSLPTYPFSGQHYWYATAIEEQKTEEPDELCLYRPEWLRQDLKYDSERSLPGLIICGRDSGLDRAVQSSLESLPVAPAIHWVYPDKDNGYHEIFSKLGRKNYGRYCILCTWDYGETSVKPRVSLFEIMKALEQSIGLAGVTFVYVYSGHTDLPGRISATAFFEDLETRIPAF